jgi:hypothetical protein
MDRYKKFLVSSDDSQLKNVNGFPAVFSREENVQFSNSNEPDIQYEETSHFLIVTSKSRDSAMYPSTSNFVVNLENEYRNVRSIELIQAIFPDKSSVTQQPYLLLQIDEIEDVMDSPDNAIRNSFAFLCTNTATEPGFFITIDRSVHENTPKVYKDLRSSLNRLSIRLVDPTGNLFSFGNPVDPFDKLYQTTFIFKIVTVEKSRMKNRAVF